MDNVHHVSISVSRDCFGQKRLNGLRSCLEWILLGTKGTLYGCSMWPLPNYFGLLFCVCSMSVKVGAYVYIDYMISQPICIETQFLNSNFKNCHESDTA